jgi:hypothetical protein
MQQVSRLLYTKKELLIEGLCRFLSLFFFFSPPRVLHFFYHILSLFTALYINFLRLFFSQPAPPRRCWPGLAPREALSLPGARAFLTLALPATAMLCIEWVRVSFLPFFFA